MRRIAAAAAAGAILAAAGCGSVGASHGTGQQGQSSSAGSRAAASPVPTPSKTIASKRVSVDGKHLPVQVYDLYRHGDLATLKFGLKNTTHNKLLAGGTVLRGSPFGRAKENDVSGVYLVDGKHKKKYLPAHMGQECLCSTHLDEVKVAPGQTLYLYATYAAPPTDVASVNVTFGKLGTITGVPVR